MNRLVRTVAAVSSAVALSLGVAAVADAGTVSKSSGRSLCVSPSGCTYDNPFGSVVPPSRWR
ncbi:hypothetical protein [Jiangella muralis]|uniref:hypothetical protein n=1 Tax=Jiangella muralis TaxID=702383 RepID=UPI00069D9384|nr:hypothetical protein [Jiangella muralis]